MFGENINEQRKIEQSKNQQLSQQTIPLSQVINQSEYHRLLEENSLSQEFNSFLLHDDVKKYPPRLTKDEINSLNESLDDKSIKQCQKAYQRLYMNKKRLLQNPFFVSSLSSQSQIKQQNDHEQNCDYLTQYRKWKNQTKENSIIIQEQKNVIQNDSKKQIFYQAKHKFPNQNYEQMPIKSKQQSRTSQNLMELQLKRINDEYLSKITDITRKNIGICCSNIIRTVDVNEQSLSNDGEKSSTNESIVSGKSLCNNIGSNHLISQTRKIKPIEDDIHEYCFENMIKHKPLLIQNKNKSQVAEEPIKLNDKSDLQPKFKQNFINNSSLTTISNISFPFYDPITAKPQQQKQIFPPIVKLNIQKLLKLPYKEFILFFQTNHNRIITLTKPEQYAKLKQYHIKCLQHAESVEKLKSKFSSQNGAKLLKQLSLEQKEKLFRVLYS